MKGTITVKFGPYVADTGGGIIPLEILDGNNQRVFGVSQTLRLDSPEKIELPRGDYLVRAYLPTGELLSKRVKLKAGDAKTANLEPEFGSPRESLSWGFLLKGPNRFGSIENHNLIAKTERERAQDYTGPPDIDLGLMRYESKTGWRTEAGKEALTLHGYDIAPDSIGQTEIYDVKQPVWLSVRGSPDTDLFVAIPPAKRVRVNLFRDFTWQDPINVVVDIGNPEAESILGFMRRGDFDFARQIGKGFAERSEMLLLGEYKDVSAAAIGGYLLLVAGDIGRLRDWTKNLYQDFPSLPDGAVIYGWHCLKQGKPNFEHARELFLEAATRGIPAYTRGFRLLLDGLEIMRARARESERVEPDAQVETTLKTLNLLASVADWSASTTTLKGLQAKGHEFLSADSPAPLKRLWDKVPVVPEKKEDPSGKQASEPKPRTGAADAY